jgi:oxygen-independent coproporphyrinogen-3 oxidase
MTALREELERNPYAGYAYSYPHKSAYRPLVEPRRLRDIWADEPKERLFLYLHVPFCEAKCAYCNLFSLPGASLPGMDAYVAALIRQLRATVDELGPLGISVAAVGGGTPSLLNEAQIQRLFAAAAESAGVDWERIPVSVEVSPATASGSKLALLRELGATRLSVGVQSFHEGELRTLARRQTPADTERVLAKARDLGFPTLNIDLIYGIPGQTPQTWQHSLQRALANRPEELYLYPLYRRPHTALGQSMATDREADQRPGLYRMGRDFLLAAGYEQLSMRCFRLPTPATESPVDYCCQRDGMIGLGCGARSYTRALHYAWPYAAVPAEVRNLVAAYADPQTDHTMVRHAFRLDRDEQQRRFAIKSLLRLPGLDRSRFQTLFGTDPLDALPQLRLLLDAQLAEPRADHLVLTPAGLELSDAIGPWLYSPRVRELAGDCA